MSSPATSFHTDIARTPAELRIAADLVARIYEGRIGIPNHAPPPPDSAGGVVTLLTRSSTGEAAATLTIQSSALADTGAARPLELERRYRFRPGVVDPRRVAELRRLALATGGTAATRSLFDRAASLCSDAGIERWLALIAAEAIEPEELQCALARETLSRRSAWLLERRGVARPNCSMQRNRRLPVPARIRLFQRRFDATAAGLPTRHPVFESITVVPMVCATPNSSQADQ